MVKNKFVQNSAKILSPDPDRRVAKCAGIHILNKAHGRWQRPCENIAMLSQMDVWTINTVST